MSSTDDGYDLLAPKFDHTPFRTPQPVLDAVALHIGEAETALDICCGTGAGVAMLRPHVARHVFGLDRSEGMLGVARRQLEDAPGNAAVTFVRGDALAQPFPARFDVVTCFGAFGHILPEDEARLVKAVAGSLRAGGRFIFVTSNPPKRLSRRWMVSRAFNAAIHIRNTVWRSEFVMYYLTFLLPRARRLLEDAGFTVEDRGPCGRMAPFEDLRVVVATLDS